MRTGEECALKSGPKPGVEGGISAVPVFEMIIDASPDTNNGVFRRYHVGNNPVNFRDPLGLAKVNYVPPSGCEYYKIICEDEKCPERDIYACEAYKCCKAYGDNPTDNCVRGCLIEYDKRNCAHLTGEERNVCRRTAHFDCYHSCMALGEGASALIFGPPEECVGAMNAVGGFGF